MKREDVCTLNFKTYHMPIDDRFSNSSFFIEHWKMMIAIITVILIIGIVSTLYSFFKKEEGVREIIRIVISTIGIVITVLGIVFIALISVSVYSVYKNTSDMHYYSYEGEGIVTDAKSSSKLFHQSDKQIVYFNAGIKKYSIVLPNDIDVNKGDTIKVSSNGKVIGNKEVNKSLLNSSMYSEGHKIDVELKHNNKWYDVDAEMYD